MKFEIDSGIFLLEEGREKVYLNKNKRENNIEIIILLFYIVILYNNYKDNNKIIILGPGNRNIIWFLL